MAQSLQWSYRGNPNKTSLQNIGVDSPTTPEAQGLIDAINAIVLGGQNPVSLVDQTQIIAAVVAATPGDALVTNKWLFRYLDNVDNSVHQLEIGTADISLLSDGSLFLPVDAGLGATVKTNFDTVARSPEQSGGVGGGNAVTLLSIEYVPRPRKR